MPQITTNQRIAVLLDADFDFGMQILQGVKRYARRQPNWQILSLHYTQEETLYTLLRQHRLTGVIGPVVSDLWLAGLPGTPIPMVNVSDHSDIHSVSSVITDNQQVGRLAARHLMQQGYARFGLLFEKASAAAVHRAAGFSRTLAKAGHQVTEPPASDSYAINASWPGWLAALPRPCGIFCSSDYLARRLLAHIHALPAKLPDDFGIVGVGNTPLDNLLADTPLTSIQLDAVRIGEEAAHQLASKLENPDLAPRLVTCEPAQLVPRTSSARQIGTADPLVARALACQTLAQPLTSDQLAKLCGASRRTLETRFRKSVGCGPATALRKRRLEHATLLLRETLMPIASIAEATGYSESAAFSTAFRKAYGLPPGAWRRQHQTSNSASPAPEKHHQQTDPYPATNHPLFLSQQD